MKIGLPSQYTRDEDTMTKIGIFDTRINQSDNFETLFEDLAVFSHL